MGLLFITSTVNCYTHILFAHWVSYLSLCIEVGENGQKADEIGTYPFKKSH